MHGQKLLSLNKVSGSANIPNPQRQSLVVQWRRWPNSTPRTKERSFSIDVKAPPGQLFLKRRRTFLRVARKCALSYLGKYAVIEKFSADLVWQFRAPVSAAWSISSGSGLGSPGVEWSQIR